MGLSGCITPSAGPRNPGATASAEPFPYALVPVDSRVTTILTAVGEPGSFGAFKSRAGPSDLRIGYGDILNVTIFEASAGGLFIPADGDRPGNFITVPEQQVDRSGNISVPFAGAIHVAGQTLAAAQATIQNALANRAIEPQVVISIKDRRSAQISVLGLVNEPTQFVSNPAGERVLDAIARAGGPSIQGFESFVTLQRGNKKATIYFNRLVSEPENNVYVIPGDVIYVFREIRSFVAVGASGANGRFNFDSETLTLAEAIGRSGGLLDNRANPEAVLVYRREPRELAEKLGVDASKFDGDTIPVIYQLDLSEQPGFFLASDFPVRNRDILYIANASGVELVKALNLLRVGVAAASETHDLAKDLND